MTTLVFEITMETPSAANQRVHWGARSRQVSQARRRAYVHCPRWDGGPLLVVTFTRIAPRRLDDDNLRGALKAVRDGVASRFRIDDASPLVAWEYGQEQGSPARVRVEIRRVEGTAFMQEPEWTGERAREDNGLPPKRRPKTTGGAR